MRHGRKSRSVLFDGYKRHVLRDLDTGLVPAVGITPANAPEASVTDAIAADLSGRAAPVRAAHRPGLPGRTALVRDRDPDLAIFRMAWRVRNTGGRFAEDQFALDFVAGQLTCPAEVTMPFEPGRTVHFPEDTCAACTLRTRCTHQQQRAQRVHPPRLGAAGRATPAPANPGRTREAARTRRGGACRRPRWPLARPPRPVPRYPQEPVRPAPRRRRPQPPHHRPPVRHRRLPARRLTAT